MNDFLGWIARNAGIAFVLAALACISLYNILSFLTDCVRALTGKYPPRVGCDCDVPCYCCREARCQPGCGCWDGDDDDEA